MIEGYLIDFPEREHIALKRLPLTYSQYRRMLRALGLFAPLTWYLIEVNKDRLDGSQGDVDILAGRLKWRNQQEWETVLADEAKGKEDWDPTQVEYIAALRLAESGGLE